MTDVTIESPMNASLSHRNPPSKTNSLKVNGSQLPAKYGCYSCSFRTQSKSKLRLHMMNHKKGVDKNVGKKTDLKTKKDYILKGHKNFIYRCTNFNPYECTICHYKCSSLKFVESHVRTHTGKMAFECDECDYVSNNRTALTRHIEGHRGIFKWTCPHCPYKTQYQGNLKTHVLRRHNKKPLHKSSAPLSADEVETITTSQSPNKPLQRRKQVSHISSKGSLETRKSRTYKDRRASNGRKRLSNRTDSAKENNNNLERSENGSYVLCITTDDEDTCDEGGFSKHTIKNTSLTRPSPASKVNNKSVSKCAYLIFDNEMQIAEYLV